MTAGQKFFDDYCRISEDGRNAYLLCSKDGKYRTPVKVVFCNALKDCADDVCRIYALLNQQFEDATIRVFWPAIHKAKRDFDKHNRPRPA